MGFNKKNILMLESNCLFYFSLHSRKIKRNKKIIDIPLKQRKISESVQIKKHWP